MRSGCLRSGWMTCRIPKLYDGRNPTHARHPHYDTYFPLASNPPPIFHPAEVVFEDAVAVLSPSTVVVVVAPSEAHTSANCVHAQVGFLVRVLTLALTHSSVSTGAFTSSRVYTTEECCDGVRGRAPVCGVRCYYSGCGTANIDMM